MNDQNSSPLSSNNIGANDSVVEQLSALMDGELPRDQVRFLLRRIDNEPGLGLRWSRQHLAGAALRHEFVVLTPGVDFAAAVMAKLDAEPGRRPIAMRVLRWAGGGSIAAAVAIVALVVSKPAGENALVHAPSVATAIVETMPARALSNELRSPVKEPFALPAKFDYAQPASFESVPNYSPMRRYAVPISGVPEGFLPSVLVPFGPGGRAPSTLHGIATTNAPRPVAVPQP